MYWGLARITQISSTWILLNAHCKRSCWQCIVTLIFFGNQQNRSLIKRRKGLKARVGKKRKDENVIQVWRSCEEEVGSRGRALSGLSSPGFLWICLGVLFLSIPAGWNWVLFYTIPSEEAPLVLVLSNWKVMSVLTSVSEKCGKYSNIKWSPFYSNFSSFHCFLPDGVPVPFSKAFDTVLITGCFFN